MLQCNITGLKEMYLGKNSNFHSQLVLMALAQRKPYTGSVFSTVFSRILASLRIVAALSAFAILDCSPCKTTLNSYHLCSYSRLFAGCQLSGQLAQGLIRGACLSVPLRHCLPLDCHQRCVAPGGWPSECTLGAELDDIVHRVVQ